ncbi:CRISPR system precrRNA processing endoribonuclease RAMP protein Cas6 [Geobacillus sp. YF-1]|uniref:CRISPR system precrRNA processing endoribonuclease RAMP protein Cas6 n=1 Tax=Geobacillus sp. YF-1 TaxID=3457480 RepID=UPI00404583DE
MSSIIEQLVDSFPYIHLRVVLECQSAGYISKYKASMIRGIVARVFKKQVCYDIEAACSNCSLNDSCMYAAVFESPHYLVHRLNRGGTVPHPYIIRCGDGRTFFQTGDHLSFDMILFGRYAKVFAIHLLSSFGGMEQYGFGRERLLFRTLTIYQILDAKSIVLMDGNSIVAAPKESRFQYQERPYEEVRLQFVTPCRMIRKGKVLRNFSVEEFLWQVRHRAYHLLLLHHEQGDTVAWGDLPLLHQKDVAIVSEEWEELSRYSMRQQQKVYLGGIKATLAMRRSNALDQWLPLLSFNEKFHVGKGTSFGLGQYELWFR